MRIHPPKICRSIEVSSSSMKRTFKSCHFIGLPVMKGCSIILSSKNTSEVVQVHRVNGSEAGMVSFDTIVINDQRTEDSQSQTGKVSDTSVVREIIRRFVEPCLRCHENPSVSRKLLVRGILLVGPPGTGKTFAVTAVREFIKVRATVRPNFPIHLLIHEINYQCHIIDINIPSLLTSDDGERWVLLLSSTYHYDN